MSGELKRYGGREGEGSVYDSKWELLSGNIITPKSERLVDAFHNTRYRDEYVGSEWVAPNGVAAPDKVSITTGGVTFEMYGFDGGVTEERISNMFEINHDVDATNLNNGSLAIEWHVHFMPSDNSGGSIIWFFDYVYLPVHGAPVAQTSLQATTKIDINAQYNHLLCGAELPVPTGGYHIGDIILFTLRRKPNTAGDDYAADVLLLKTALHVPTDGLGSRQRYIK